ncbi:MAG: hypothetical protein Kow00105_14680 [Phycisphaeraceae bacterium]
MDPLQREELDAATAKRLAKLARSAPDVSALKQKLDAALDEAQHASDVGRSHPPRAYPFHRYLKPIASLAAVLALTITALLLVNLNSPSATAAAIDLVQLHRDLAAGRIAMVPVQSADQANRWIASQRADAPALPKSINADSVRSCCLADVHGKLVAVALIRHDQADVTLVVADAPGFAVPMGKTYQLHNRTLHAHEIDGINMVMTSRDNRWLCVMGDLDQDSLADLAAQIEF